jgi:hypothetical protein
MKCPTILLCFLFCPLLCTAGIGKVITVEKSKFSDVYPAVWFSPGTGEIVPIKERSEEPPEAKYEVWIEPRDPEFGFSSSRNEAEAKKIGFSLVGKGTEVFENTETWNAANLDRKLTYLTKATQGSEGLVFYCKGTSSSCLIMITEMDRKKEIISFRWKPLRKQE